MFVILLVFIFGLFIGSFLNVLIYRLPRGLGFVKGRSFCPKCKKKISWYDNIPVFSFVFLRGKCRQCRSPISLRYPIVELLTGCLFVLIINQIGQIDLIKQILHLVLISGLIVIFFIDLEHRIIPDEIIFPVIFLFFLFSLISNRQLLITNYLPSALGAFFFLFLIWAISRGRGMGFGDVKLAFLMGLCLGFPKIIIAFYIAFLTGALSGVILILVKKAKFGQQIAFGPFLALGTFTALIWGEKILETVQKSLLG